jgi:hypothetical protein
MTLLAVVRCGGPAGKMRNGCRRLREPIWALPSVAGCGVIIVAGAGTTVGRSALLTWLDYRAREPR